MKGTVAIIGGGIGGLAAAVALDQRGWRPTVYEREPDLSGAGTALGIWPAALRALDTIGLGDRVRTLGQPQRAGTFQRLDGGRIAAIDVAKLERRTGDPVILLSRPALLALLCEAVDPSVLRFATPVRDLDPLRREHDLVVAADGIFSRVRVGLFGAGWRARYTGSTAWRGWLDGMATEAFTETWGAGAKFGVTPQEGDRTNWYATTTAPEGAFSPGAELAELRSRFGDWAAPVGPVLDAIREDGILRHDLYAVPRLASFVRHNVALIGDAAHGMPPDLGRGACEALIDAVALAEALERAPTVADGLQRYDRQRRRTVQRLASIAGAAAGLTRLRPLWLRDALLRAAMLGGPPS
ncbi:FAD-dependent oxidoreductase [Micromonospora sp. NPDC047740]|uniref:FAD-dependent oxidoreductase n=1 Tax=Micromonospora sp. NPDC047740 TaxID=3364254 RepID=UPI003716CD39